MCHRHTPDRAHAAERSRLREDRRRALRGRPASILRVATVPCLVLHVQLEALAVPAGLREWRIVVLMRVVGASIARAVGAAGVSADAALAFAGDYELASAR